MSRVRVSLTGAALQAADRILAATPIEGYSELFSFLLRRYEQDFITACNGFLVPQAGHSVPPVPQQTTIERTPSPQAGQAVPHVPQQTAIDTNAEPLKGHSDQVKPSVGQVVPPAPQQTARQRLMDFED